MRLFHFSEEPDIAVFDPFDGLVWAIDDEMAVNYLFPRECRPSVWPSESVRQTEARCRASCSVGWGSVGSLEAESGSG